MADHCRMALADLTQIHLGGRSDCSAGSSSVSMSASMSRQKSLPKTAQRLVAGYLPASRCKSGIRAYPCWLTFSRRRAPSVIGATDKWRSLVPCFLSLSALLPARMSSSHGTCRYTARHLLEYYIQELRGNLSRAHRYQASSVPALHSIGELRSLP
jgi:hypothetical protein